MKKIIVLATAAFLFTGVAFANNCEKCKKGGKECGKECMKSEKKDCCKKDAKTATATKTTTKAKA
jgi:hypothetical protein